MPAIEMGALQNSSQAYAPTQTYTVYDRLDPEGLRSRAKEWTTPPETSDHATGLVRHTVPNSKLTTSYHATKQPADGSASAGPKNRIAAIGACGTNLNQIRETYSKRRRSDKRQSPKCQIYIYARKITRQLRQKEEHATQWPWKRWPDAMENHHCAPEWLDPRQRPRGSA